MSITDVLEDSSNQTQSAEDGLGSVLASRPWLGWCTDISTSTKALRAYAGLHGPIRERLVKHGSGTAYLDQREAAAITGVNRKALFRGEHPVVEELASLGLVLVTEGSSRIYHRRGDGGVGDATGWLLEPLPVSGHPDATGTTTSLSDLSTLKELKAHQERTYHCGVHVARTAKALLDPAATAWAGTQGDHGWRLTAILLRHVCLRHVKITGTQVAGWLGISERTAKRTLALLVTYGFVFRAGRAFVWDLAKVARLVGEELGDPSCHVFGLELTAAAAQKPHRVESQRHVKRLMGEPKERTMRIITEPIPALAYEPPSAAFLAWRDETVARVRAPTPTPTPDRIERRTDPRVLAAAEAGYLESRARWAALPRRVGRPRMQPSKRPRSGKPVRVCTVQDCEGRRYHAGLCEMHDTEAERVACAQRAKAFQRSRETVA